MFNESRIVDCLHDVEEKVGVVQTSPDGVMNDQNGVVCGYSGENSSRLVQIKVLSECPQNGGHRIVPGCHVTSFDPLFNYLCRSVGKFAQLLEGEKVSLDEVDAGRRESGSAEEACNNKPIHPSESPVKEVNHVLDAFPRVREQFLCHLYKRH